MLQENPGFFRSWSIFFFRGLHSFAMKHRNESGALMTTLVTVVGGKHRNKRNEQGLFHSTEE
jgi:hypothetical protein